MLKEHLLIMKEANALREESLLLTQACASTFWSEYNELLTNLNNISNQLSQIRRRSTSSQQLEQEKEKCDQLTKGLSDNQIKFQEILQTLSVQLLTLISNNQQETDDIQHCLHDLEQEWNRVALDLNNCQDELTQSIIKSAELNAKLENVSTWLEDTTSFTTNIEKNNDLEHIKIFKEHLENKYIDIMNIKQDYTDIEQPNEHAAEEQKNLVEEQLVEIDSKWTQLNEKIQEQ